MKRQGFDYLKKVSAIDYGTRIEVFYVLYGTESKKEEVAFVKLDSGAPWINSVVGVYKAADWYEREMAEMFGIKIKGRRTRRLLLEKWNGSGYPLRRSFRWGDPNYKRSEAEKKEEE
jgi:NADH-quinone oxidoreductase subunit C